MGTFDNVKQKIEGNLDELKGNIQQSQGETIKGGISIAKGKIKKATAPFHNLDDDREDERV